MSKQEKVLRTQVGKTLDPAAQKAQFDLIFELYFSMTALTEQEFNEVLEKLLKCYLLSEFVENDPFDERDKIVVAYSELKRAVKLWNEAKVIV